MSQILSGFDISLVIAFIVTFTALNFTPGPAVLKVVSDSITNGIWPAHASMMGVFAANFMYAILAVIGMSALLIAFPVIFFTVKWIGVGYLAYLAYHAFTQIGQRSDNQISGGISYATKKLFWSSFATQGANPKSILSFGAMLPVFAGSGEGIEIRMLILATLNMFLEYPALLFYAFLGASASRIASRGKARNILHAISGSSLVIAAWMISRTSIKTG